MAISENPMSEFGRPATERRNKIELAKLEGLKAIREKEDQANVFTEQAIRSKFSLSTRLFQTCCGCMGKQQDGAEKILANEPLFTFFEKYPELKDQNLAVKLQIRSTGILDMDPNVLHPFVRIHIVDMEKRKYLAKSDPVQPGVTSLESVNFYKISQNESHTREKKAYKAETDFFLPLSTKMFDMRVAGTNYCQWDEDFIINERADLFFNKNVVLLFEILDFCPQLIASQST